MPTRSAAHGRSAARPAASPAAGGSHSHRCHTPPAISPGETSANPVPPTTPATPAPTTGFLNSIPHTAPAANPYPIGARRYFHASGPSTRGSNMSDRNTTDSVASARTPLPPGSAARIADGSTTSPASASANARPTATFTAHIRPTGRRCSPQNRAAPLVCSSANAVTPAITPAMSASAGQTTNGSIVGMSSTSPAATANPESGTAGPASWRADSHSSAFSPSRDFAGAAGTAAVGATTAGSVRYTAGGGGTRSSSARSRSGRV
ncbi:hypothetical protein J0H58_11385 [bacterium]|nr:hypothetical protein [bacterium]